MSVNGKEGDFFKLEKQIHVGEFVSGFRDGIIRPRWNMWNHGLTVRSNIALLYRGCGLVQFFVDGVPASLDFDLKGNFTLIAGERIIQTNSMTALCKALEESQITNNVEVHSDSVHTKTIWNKVD